MKFNIRSLAAFAMICLLTIFMGCSGGGGGGGGTSGSGGTGSLAVSLTDAPKVGYEAVYVTIDRVEVHLGGNQASPNNWQTIEPPESGVTGFVKKTFNLLDLRNGILEELGTTELPAGFYTQMRLFLGTEADGGLNILGETHDFPNYVIVSGTSEVHELKVPSGYQTGIKLVKGFTVGKSQLTELVIDFDAEKSVVKAGNSGQYILKPTIKVLDAIALYNYIEGTVVDEYGTGLGGVSVSAQETFPLPEDPIRDEVDVAGTSMTEGDGWFRILVPPGTGPYNVIAYKDKYGFNYQCGVDAASGVTTELILPDLETEPPGYGYVSGDVMGTGEVTISFRTPGCEGNIEVKSITRNVDQGPALYEEILPVLPEDTYYEVVASSFGKDPVVVSGVTIESGVTRFLDPLVVE
jgi:hypothetical protein